MLALAFSADGKRFVSASADGTIHVRERDSGALLQRLVWKPAHVHESPEGTTLTTRMVNVNVQQVWLEAGDVVGSQFVIAAGSPTTGMAQETIVRWDAASGKELSRQNYYAQGTTVSAATLLASSLSGGRTSVSSPRITAIAPQLGVLARATPSGHIQLSSLATGANVLESAHMHNSCVNVEMARNEVAVVRQRRPDLVSLELEDETDPPTYRPRHPAAPGGLHAQRRPARFPDARPRGPLREHLGRRQGQGAGPRARLEPGALGTTSASSIISSRTTSVAAVRLPAISPNGRRIALRGRDGKLRVVDTDTGKDIANYGFTWKGDGTIAFTPDGAKLVVSDATDIRRFVAGAGTQRELKCNVNVIDLLADADLGPLQRVSYDFAIGRLAVADRHLVVGTKDGAVRLISLASGRHVRDLIPLKQKGDPNAADAVVLSSVNRTPFFVMSPDQRVIALRMPDGAISVLEIATGMERFQLRAPTVAQVNGMAFAADGKHFVAGCQDGTVIVWDLHAPSPIKVNDPAALWPRLADLDAASAHVAQWKLAASPEAAVKLCKENLGAAAGPPPKEVRKKIDELDSTIFALRQKAQDDLIRWGEAVRPELEKAAQRPTISGEAKLRIDAILKRLDESILTGEQLRDLRAVELLERLQTPEAIALLERYAKGDAATSLARQAQDVLNRRWAQTQSKGDN